MPVDYRALIRQDPKFQIEIKSDDECWAWYGRRDTNWTCTLQHGGILAPPQFHVYLATRGNVPIEKRVYMLCKTLDCCNPAHMTLITDPYKKRKSVGRLRAKDRVYIERYPDYRGVAVALAKLFDIPVERVRKMRHEHWLRIKMPSIYKISEHS